MRRSDRQQTRAGVGRRTGLWAGLAVLGLVGSLVPGVARGVTSAPVVLRTLSNRADLISGGNALVEVVLPAGATIDDLDIAVDGRNVRDAFAVRPGGRVYGLVTGLALGPNVLRAQADGPASSLMITNHPIGGPVFAGPQIQPWACAAGALDAQCNRPPTYSYRYKSTNPARTGFQTYDPANPPTDVAQTTTDTGKTVPFIVRLEKGVIDRDEYAIAVLYDPAKPWAPWAPQDGFNRKLVITHGASCDTAYAQGAAPDVLKEAMLGRGYAIMSNALDNAGHNCNIITQAESLVMTKEHLIDTYGEVRYTIGSGCSGGSLVQLQIANAFPGLYQGITPQCSYPDAWSSAMQYEDYHLIRDYFEAPNKWGTGVAWGPAQVAAVNGHPNPGNPVTFTEVIPDSGYPNRSCPGLPAAKMYHKTTNPTGVRCTLADYMVNVFGRRAEDGFARVPWDNTGVQYGLRGLMSGTLSPAQFADINAKIGGRTIDHDPQAARVDAEPGAVAAVYRSGAVNSANHLDEVAIIDLRGPDPGAFHDVYRTYALRARLEREHGTAANQIIWRGPVALLGDATYVDQSVFAVDQWLAAVAADTSDRPVAEKIVKNRPATVTDRCQNGTGQAMPVQFCDNVVTSYTTPRIEAGMPFTDDVVKCQLKPLRASDYYPVAFAPAEWALLQQAFPTGVCDYAKPGVEQQGAVAWMTYNDQVGGRPLGPPPQSSVEG